MRVLESGYWNEGIKLGVWCRDESYKNAHCTCNTGVIKSVGNSCFFKVSK